MTDKRKETLKTLRNITEILRPEFMEYISENTKDWKEVEKWNGDQLDRMFDVSMELLEDTVTFKDYLKKEMSNVALELFPLLEAEYNLILDEYFDFKFYKNLSEWVEYFYPEDDYEYNEDQGYIPRKDSDLFPEWEAQRREELGYVGCMLEDTEDVFSYSPLEEKLKVIKKYPEMIGTLFPIPLPGVEKLLEEW